MSRCARDGKPFVVARGPLSRDTLVPDIAICLIGHAISQNRVRGDEFHVEHEHDEPALGRRSIDVEVPVQAGAGRRRRGRH